MHCPFCGHLETSVSNSRPTKHAKAIWRRRSCNKCKKTFSTYEKITLDFLRVEKRSGKKVCYMRDKLFASIYDAISGGKHVDRGDAAQRAKETVEEIEGLITHSQDVTIKTSQLIDLVTDILEIRDLGACYRYASFSSYRGMKFGVSK